MRHVLIVDDESGIRLALRRFFERRQWAVDDAADGDAAIARLLHPDLPVPDLVVCDLNLPGQTGEQILARLATERPELVARVILTTGDDVEGAPPGSILATHPHILQKPFDLAAMTRQIDALFPSA